MGSGKSHTGRRLGDLLNLPFIDLDAFIEAQEGLSVQEIFSRYGEDFFRRTEQRALHQMLDHEAAIISCGGGTPCFFDNMTWMNQHGITAYLQTPVETLFERLLPEMAHRPLLDGQDEETLPAFIAAKLALREPHYLQAQIIADVPGALEDMLMLLKTQLDEREMRVTP